MIVPKAAIVHYNEGTALLNKKKFERAIKSFKASISHGGSELPELWLNLGNVYKGQNKFLDAATAYQKAASLRANYKLAENNLGLIYHGIDRDEEAGSVFQACEDKNRDYRDIKWNYGLHKMRMASSTNTGWEDAYNYYHYRFVKESNPVRVKNDFGALPMWDGVKVGRVMVVAEQGAGDIIQFARYVRPGMSVQADESLGALLQQAFGPSVVVKDYFDWTQFDYWIPICELGRHFPVSGTPWIHIDADPPIYDFGYVWYGNHEHANDHNRSVDLRRFNRIAKLGNCRSFQFGDPGYDKRPYINGDYLDTALKLKSIKRLITVDTSIAHLAGSMGVETWILLPQYDVDWRWGCVGDGERSPWYDSVRLFRNTKGWDDVFNRVYSELQSALVADALVSYGEHTNNTIVVPNTTPYNLAMKAH